MTIQDWGSVGEILGAVATIATLIYLAMQIRQNTQALQAASIDSTIRAANDIRAHLFSDAHVTDIYRRGLANVDDLDETDRERFQTALRDGVKHPTKDGLVQQLWIYDSRLLKEWVHTGVIVAFDFGEDTVWILRQAAYAPFYSIE